MIMYVHLARRSKQFVDSLLNCIIAEAQCNHDEKVSRTSGLMSFYCIDCKFINSELNGALCAGVNCR